MITLILLTMTGFWVAIGCLIWMARHQRQDADAAYVLMVKLQTRIDDLQALTQSLDKDRSTAFGALRDRVDMIERKVVARASD